MLPAELIIVNDGSTDNTENVIKGYQKRLPWIRLVNHEKKAGYSSGAKVVRAFYVGYNTLEMDWDVLVKLDADLSLPANYFEVVLGHFEEASELGIVGGIIMLEKKWSMGPRKFFG